MFTKKVSEFECKKRVDAQRKASIIVFRNLLTVRGVGEVLDDEFYDRLDRLIADIPDESLDNLQLNKDMKQLRKDLWDKIIDSIFKKVNIESKK